MPEETRSKTTASTLSSQYRQGNRQVENKTYEAEGMNY